MPKKNDPTEESLESGEFEEGEFDFDNMSEQLLEVIEMIVENSELVNISVQKVEEIQEKINNT